MSRQNRYSPEVRERAVRLVLEHQGEHDSQWAAIGSIAGKSVALEDGSDVRVSEFEIGKYPDLGPPESSELRTDVNKITGTENREVMILGRRSGGALVFAVQSRQDDALLPYVFKSVGEAARNQLSRKRAGMVLVGLDGLSGEELVRAAQYDKDPAERPTALRVEVSKFLGGNSTDHLVGVGFLSRDEMVPKGNGHVSAEGTAYHFPKRESCFWHEDFSGLFAEQE